MKKNCGTKTPMKNPDEKIQNKNPRDKKIIKNDAR